jgi:translation initiation factor 1
MGKRRKQEPHQGEAKAPFHSPFAGLAGLRDALPEGEAAEDEAAPEGGEHREATARVPPRAVVRYQRKGRGGKEVTLIEKLGLSAGERERWLKALKRDLGCGGVVEGEVIALQGDQRARLPGLLERRGVGRVSGS